MRSASHWYGLSAITATIVILTTFSSCSPTPPNVATPPAAAVERDPNRLWCNEHGLYEDECLICHPELANKVEDHDGHDHDHASEVKERDPNRLWCNEHGLYEDECLICHPELASKVEDHTGHDHASEEKERDPNRLWCNEHGLYEDECLICHPELANKVEDHDGHDHAEVTEKRDPNRLWCNEHSVYEDECLICHPELEKKSEANAERDPNRLWCNEHSIYEDECLLCHPELAKKPVAMVGGLQCLEHDVLERECGICHPELLAQMVPGQGLKVRFESLASAEKAGVQTGFPVYADRAAEGNVLGEMTYNMNELAYITPALDGVIKRVLVDAGDVVEAGQLLAEIAAPGLASERSAYAKAVANRTLHREAVAREQKLVAEKISARQDLEQAQARLAEAEAEIDMAIQRLHDMGLSAEEITTKTDTATSAFPVRAPFAGTITERNAVAGAAVSTGTSLFQVANLSSMWMDVSVPEAQVLLLEKGMPIQAQLDAAPGLLFPGKLTWLSTSVDETTRMVRGRAEIPNPDGLLRNAMFGSISFTNTNTTPTLALPETAIQYVDGLPIVFAKLEPGLFETRLIRAGAAVGTMTPILEGLSENDEIVLGQSYVLKSELLKARLGAGCVHD